MTAEQSHKAQEEGENAEEAEERRPLWDNDVPQTPEFYANMAFVDETASDVTILFGSFFKEDSVNSHQTCKARVVMSHVSFLAFADRVTKEAQFLRRLYKMNELPSIANIDDATWSAIFEEVYGENADKSE